MNNIQNLKARAKLTQQIRAFFEAKDVIEVQTPLLAHAPVTDPYLDAFEVDGKYLQTSPEYAMKGLLADGIGSCYQICKAFRVDETGKLHNPEFTILEWYRVGFNDHDLMNETDELLQLILKCQRAIRLSYNQAFKQFLDIDLTQNLDLQKYFESQFGKINGSELFSKDDWLMLLFTHGIEPKLTGDAPFIIYDYPASQAALAKTKVIDGVDLASRFEVFYKGVELANAYHELTDPTIQRKRFEQDLKTRETLGRPAVPIDEELIKALEKGLPDCAGIALGLDRLIMLAIDADSIQSVI